MTCFDNAKPCLKPVGQDSPHQPSDRHQRRRQPIGDPGPRHGAA